MRKLGNLSGIGQLLDGNKPLGSVRYLIDVWEEPNRRRDAAGDLWGDEDCLMAALNCERNTLVLQNGEKVEVLVVEHNFGTDHARISVSGPVPGY
jgi:hypothetical protein